MSWMYVAASVIGAWIVGAPGEKTANATSRMAKALRRYLGSIVMMDWFVYCRAQFTMNKKFI